MKKKYHIKNSAESAKRSWLEVVWNEKTTEPATIRIEGQIGKSWWDDSGTSSEQFNDALDKIPKGTKINLRINSEGGSVQDGLGIYNAILARSEDITAHIDGYALSAGSFIPLAAGNVVSPKSSIWMIHSASVGAFGNEQEHLKAAEMLKAHDETLVGIYADRTGKNRKEIRTALEAETWFTGDEAVAWGLADESPDEDLELQPMDIAAFKNIPENIKLRISPANNGERKPVAVASAQPVPNTMNKTEILALLKKNGIEIAADATEATILAALGTLGDKKTPAASGDDEVKKALAAITTQLESERKLRITGRVKQCVTDCRIPAAQVETWVNRAMKDEAILADLESMPVNKPGSEPIGAGMIEGGVDRFIEILAEKDNAKRLAFMKKDWKAIQQEAENRDKRGGFNASLFPVNSNTYSGTLVTSFLMDGSLTDLQNVWAMLGAFSMDFSTDPYKPLASGVLKHVTAGAAAQTDATNFESGNSTVAPISVVMHQYTVSFQVSNSDLNSGLRMENLVTINTANFANKVIEIATVPITTAIFTNTPEISTAAAFNFNNLSSLQASLKKSPIKNLILDGSYVARIANTPAFFQTAGVVGGNTSAWRAFGWNLIAQNTDWTGAGTNVQGFACHPQAIVGITGLPLTPPNIPGGILSQNTMTVPGLEIPVAVYSWFNPATRTMWCSYDIMLGVKEGDTSAGTLVTSA